MPLPSYIFSESATGNDLLAPDDINTHWNLVCKEKGGVALSNPSEGIDSYTWVSSYDPLTGTITLTNEGTAVSYNVLTGLMLLETISFAFDSNMRPFIVYRHENGDAFYYWYDSSIGNYATTALPVGTVTPRATHDDKREFAVEGNKSDILLFYIVSNILYCRVQRERYLTAHQVATLVPGTVLRRVGMSTGLRMKLELLSGGLVSSP